MEKKASAKNDVTTFSKAEFVANSRVLFNTTPDIVSGALYGVNENITLDAAEELVDKFLSRKVEGGN